MEKTKIFIFTCFSLLIIFYSLIFNQVVFAQEASQSSNLSSELQALKQSLQQESASKAARLKAEILQKLSNKAYVGYVKDKADNKLNIETLSGDKSVTLNQDTDYISLSGKKITLADLNLGSYIASLGDVDESNVLTAKRIVKYPIPDKSTKKIFWAKVQAVSGSTLTVQDKNHKTLTVLTNTNTDIESGKSNVDITDIQTGAVIVVSGNEKDQTTIKASLIYLFPRSQMNVK